jgi:hypothetical protein
MEKGFNQSQLDTIYGKLGSLAYAAENLVPSIIKDTIKDIQRDVIANAPMRSGNLRRSVHEETQALGGQVYVDTRRNGRTQTNFEYGRVVEHGRAGRYKTTAYFYKPIKARLGVLLDKINAILRDAAINGK